MSNAYPSILEDQPLRIAQGEDAPFTIYIDDVVLDERRREVDRFRADLTGVTVIIKVKDSSGAIVITKSSDTPTQIDIEADQVSAATKGIATVHFDSIDTLNLAMGSDYYYDVWIVTAAGKSRRTTLKSKFTIEDGVHEPA